MCVSVCIDVACRCSMMLLAPTKRSTVDSSCSQNSSSDTASHRRLSMCNNQRWCKVHHKLLRKRRTLARGCLKWDKVKLSLLIFCEIFDVLLETCARRTRLLGKNIKVILFHHLIMQVYRLYSRNRQCSYLH